MSRVKLPLVCLSIVAVLVSIPLVYHAAQERKLESKPATPTAEPKEVTLHELAAKPPQRGDYLTIRGIAWGHMYSPTQSERGWVDAYVPVFLPTGDENRRGKPAAVIVFKKYKTLEDGQIARPYRRLKEVTGTVSHAYSDADVSAENMRKLFPKTDLTGVPVVFEGETPASAEATPPPNPLGVAGSLLFLGGLVGAITGFYIPNRSNERQPTIGWHYHRPR